MRGDPERLREWAAHWASHGHSPQSGLLLLQERWGGDGGTRLWELRLADLTAALHLMDRRLAELPPELGGFATAIRDLRDWCHAMRALGAGCLPPGVTPVLLEAISTVVEFHDSIPPDRLNPWHTVTLDDEGWVLAHPVMCDLVFCRFNAVARDWRVPPADHGSYRWDEPDGRLMRTD